MLLCVASFGSFEQHRLQCTEHLPFEEVCACARTFFDVTESGMLPSTALGNFGIEEHCVAIIALISQVSRLREAAMLQQLQEELRARARPRAYSPGPEWRAGEMEVPRRLPPCTLP